MPPTLPNTLTNGTTADASQVMADLNAINAAVDQATVTSLPGSPYDGQEIYYLADATNGVAWHLKYRSGSGSAYKWEYVGGPTLAAFVDTLESAATVGFSDLTTVGPTVTLPLAGDYDIEWGARSYANTAGTSIKYGPSLAGGGVGDYIDHYVTDVVGGNSDAVSELGSKRKTGRAASDTVKLRYTTGNAGFTGSWSARWVRAKPVRVG